MATQPPVNSGKRSTVGSLKQAQTRQRQAALKSRQTGKVGEVSPRSSLRVAVPTKPKPKKATPPAPPPPPVKKKRGIVPEHLRPFLFKKQQKPRGK